MARNPSVMDRLKNCSGKQSEKNEIKKELRRKHVNSHFVEIVDDENETFQFPVSNFSHRVLHTQSKTK